MLLDAQNSPQFVLAYYAILRCDAVVVPVSPMNVTEELAHYVSDSGATTAIIAQDSVPAIQAADRSRTRARDLGHLLGLPYCAHGPAAP